jgi:hypothetical protein
MESQEFYSAKPIPDDIPLRPIKPERTVPIRSADVVINVRPEIEVRQETEYDLLNKMYTDLTNKAFIRDKNKTDLFSLSNDFITKVDEFKRVYPDDKYKATIDKFDKSISSGQINLLKSFNEPYNFNEEITIKSYDELNILKDLVLITKNSSSNSFVFKGKYNDKSCYIKTFFIPNKNLEYEQKVYKYLKTRDDKIKPYYDDYFVKVYDICKIRSIDFKFFLNYNNVKSSNLISRWNSAEPILEEKLNTNMYIYVIVTEDIGGITYKDFFIANYNNENLITSTLFDMIYGIYLMNNRLQLMHNDNHFGNVLIKLDIPDTETKYQIESKEYTRNKNYKLCFYDFDLSFLNGEENTSLNDTWLAQNKISAKDIWTILNSLLYNNKNNIHQDIPYINNIIDVILNGSEEHKRLLNKISFEGPFWNAYCIENVQRPCTIPNEPVFYPNEVLERLINNEHIKKILNFTQVNDFYKKYLKYKNKYLELKRLK